MAFTSEKYKLMLASDLGLSNDPEFRQVVADKWEMMQDVYRTNNLYLFFLYVKAELLEHLIGGAWKLYQWSDADVSESEGQIFSNLMEMQEKHGEKLALVLRRNRGGQVVIGRLEATSPQPPVIGRPDPNDPAYKGHPLRRIAPASFEGTNYP